jgi:predicted transcriptional regulator
MKILLSIKPSFALKIFDGTKRFEYRRSIFKRTDIKNVVVYASSPLKKILGEFEIDDILSGEPANLWCETHNYSGISEKKFFEYFSDTNRGYAIKIKNYQLYDKPQTIEDSLGVSPPQSFMYLI